MHSDAKFVLVVEKEASFQRLMDDNVLQKLHPCIVITVSIYILGLLLSCFGPSSVLFRLNIWLTEEKCYYSPRFFLNHITLHYIPRDRRVYSLSTPLCISLSFVHYTYNVIIQGKGFPDVNTRMMVRCLWSTLQIPILALVDADPHGNFKCFTFFTLDGVVKISPPKGKSLLKQFTCFMNLSFL